ncbi:MAG: hypothetical protein ACRDPG_12060 [Nocardioidaceae bacterium]
MTLAVAALLTSVVGFVAPAQGMTIGDQGCTPGYWKNHTDNWTERPLVYISPDMLLTYQYGGHLGFVVTPELANDTFINALNYKGGAGTLGAEQILMRAASAAWLNAATEELGYPLRRWTTTASGPPIVTSVNAAFASNDRATMLALATTLDNDNSLGCTLS